MGTFGDYSGKLQLEGAQKEEFTQNIIKLLNAGGMMQISEVTQFGKELLILSQVALKKDKTLHFYYNYFENDTWESVVYSADNNRIVSGKIGWSEFNRVMTAIHVLYELYDDNVGYARIDDCIVDAGVYIGWINHVLGTKFSLKKRKLLWEMFENYCMERSRRMYGGICDLGEVCGWIPKSHGWAIGGTDFADICYILNGTKSLAEEDCEVGSYPYTVYQCKQAIKRFLENTYSKREEQLHVIWNLVRSSRDIRMSIKDEYLKELALISLKLPARVIVYLTAEICDMSFWKVWGDLKNLAYQDEHMEKYASEELIKEREKAFEKAIRPVKTTDFLCMEGSWYHWKTPDELKGIPDYHLTDDDRILWWNGTSEVKFSEEMEKWIKYLALRYTKILDGLWKECGIEADLQKEFVNILCDANELYGRVYAFETMFYEFMNHITDSRYHAAVLLFHQLVEENKERGKTIEMVHNWSCGNRNVVNNIGRLRIKRYLAIMANNELRKKYFHF